ncbi:MAG: DEAD/DEAH box helicase family protein [DPANN group archaeon]|nr:DEAD/DEAH box helicase family protein [DPANN group archaeon]
MKLKFKKQQFQIDAMNAVCDVFEGQGKESYKYLYGKKQGGLTSFAKDSNIYAWKNGKITIPEETILKNIIKIQKNNNLHHSTKLEGDGLNLTVEMETGTGKTYVYINTIFELNKKYNWTKFIIVVPSIAIREGVLKSFQIMEEHFATLYGKKIRHFIFDSSKQTQIESFATNSSINVMIINSHAFNKKDFKNDITNKTSNNIYKKTEHGARQIDYIAGTNPIIIIDEPQSVEGPATKEGLKHFNSLFTLRYSATHRETYNMVYRLDAVDAFNKKLVKQINVKGINIKGTTATHSYLYIEGIDISKNNYPSARIELEVKQINSIVKKTRRINRGDDLFSISSELPQYKGYKVSDITSNYIEFTNGVKVSVSDIVGNINEDHKRRIQIRETIRSHLNKERNLYKNGIKTISLFFIDEVKNYREYDEQDNNIPGKYARVFEEEYTTLIEEYKKEEAKYNAYLESITSNETHKGYFSIDKKGHLINPDEKGRGENKTCDDVSAYDLIMKQKELLLDLKEKTRFIFSHSALREGWDNPNVFQICVLRNTDPKEVRTRQEVGRGLRLCVNQQGDRVDEEYEGLDFTQANILTIIANESYEDFAHGLQNEFSQNLRERPSKLTVEFLMKKSINGERINEPVAKAIIYDFTVNKYVDENGSLTEKYHKDKDEGTLNIRDDLKDKTTDLIDIIRELYENNVKVHNEDNENKITNKINETNFNKEEFRELWDYINIKSTYTVDFKTETLITNAIKEINEKLSIIKIESETTEGKMKNIGLNAEDLKNKTAFTKETIKYDNLTESISDFVKYDLIGKIVSETSMTRWTIIEIVSKINPDKFDLFKQNPEDFLIKICKIINDEKAEIIYHNIEYHRTSETISIDIFKKNILSVGKSIDVERYIYDYLIYDSDIEKHIAEKIDASVDVLVFSKLPKGEYVINTPVGKFSPDWIIVFDKKKIQYAYFVIETKGSVQDKDWRGVEKVKIDCARKHFNAISDGNVIFDVVSSFDELRNKVKSV